MEAKTRNDVPRPFCFALELMRVTMGVVEGEYSERDDTRYLQRGGLRYHNTDIFSSMYDSPIFKSIYVWIDNCQEHLLTNE